MRRRLGVALAIALAVCSCTPQARSTPSPASAEPPLSSPEPLRPCAAISLPKLGPTLAAAPATAVEKGQLLVAITPDSGGSAFTRPYQIGDPNASAVSFRDGSAEIAVSRTGGNAGVFTAQSVGVAPFV